jgi:hypothetical protein
LQKKCLAVREGSSAALLFAKCIEFIRFRCTKRLREFK